MTDTTVIPDTIEPYYGYKALKVDKGKLVSPSQPVVWPPKQPLEATCQKLAFNVQPKWGWKLVQAPEGWEQHFWVSSETLQEGATTTFAWPPEPPPPGHTWVPDPIPHDMSKCQCGIYAVDNVQDTYGYLSGANRVICEVAVWGTTVKGDKGVRGQYAYPQKIYCGEQQSHILIPVSELYGIPLEIVEFIKEP